MNTFISAHMIGMINITNFAKIHTPVGVMRGYGKICEVVDRQRLDAKCNPIASIFSVRFGILTIV